MFFKKKKKKEITHCKKCIYWIVYSLELHLANPDKEDGIDICGHTFSSVIDEIGNEIFRTYGEKIFCEECGMLLTDNGKPVYRKCKDKNRDNKCKDFIESNLKFRLKERLNGCILTIKEMVEGIKVSRFTLLICWLLFHCLYMLYFWGKPLYNKSFIAYLLITIPILAYTSKTTKQ